MSKHIKVNCTNRNEIALDVNRAGDLVVTRIDRTGKPVASGGLGGPPLESLVETIKGEELAKLKTFFAAL
jgi:hypothetical protein